MDPLDRELLERLALQLELLAAVLARVGSGLELELARNRRTTGELVQAVSRGR